MTLLRIFIERQSTDTPSLARGARYSQHQRTPLTIIGSIPENLRDWLGQTANAHCDVGHDSECEQAHELGADWRRNALNRNATSPATLVNIARLFISSGNHAASGAPLPAGFPAAVDAEIAAAKQLGELGFSEADARIWRLRVRFPLSRSLAKFEV